MNYAVPMDTLNLDNSPEPGVETASGRQSRLAWEAEAISRARASAAAGRLVTSDAVDVWIDSLDTDQERPAPRPGQ